MSDMTQVYEALRAADSAGDTASAQKLADYLHSQPHGVAESPADPSAGGGTLQLGPFDTGIQTPQWLDRTLSGAGKAYVDIGRGVGQLVGAESRADVADARALDAPLMRTAAGKIGNVAGNVAIAVPATFIPGANTAVGAGLIGAGMGLLQPSTSTKETLTNTAIGGAAGAAGQWLGNKISNAVTNRLAARATAAQTEESLNSARDAILTQSRAEGYVIPPTAVNDSATATALESVSGKAATRQAAEAMNARVSNRLIAADLNLPTNQPITREALDQVRKTAGAIYGQVEKAGTITTDPIFAHDINAITQIGADLEKAAPGIGAQAGDKVKQLADSLLQPQFEAKDAVGLFKFLNNRAKAGFQSAFASGNPEALDIARAQRAAADAIGELLDRNLPADLSTSWQEARTTIAKSYTAEAALKGNNVDALRLAAQLRKGAYLSDGFKKVAEFGDQFGEVARVPQSGVGVSKLAATVGGGGAVTALAMGQPHLAATLAAASATPYAVRKALLSAGGQSLLASPSYAPNALGTGILNTVGTYGRYGAIPTYAGATALENASQ